MNCKITVSINSANFKQKLQTPLLSTFCFILLMMLQSSCNRKVAQISLPYDSLQDFSLNGSEKRLDDWWKAFNDSDLNQLMQLSLDSNLDIRNLYYRIRESEAIVDISSAGRKPNIDVQVRSGIQRPQPDFVGGENTQLSLRTNYEVDLWGRIKYGIEADRYRLTASIYDLQAAAISVSGDLSLAYFRLKAAKAQKELLEDQLSTNNQVLSLIKARFSTGQVRGVDLIRQQQLVKSTMAQIVDVETQIRLLSNQLNVLLGKFPKSPSIEATAELPDLPPMPDTGLPIELINRRPDVLAAYDRLQAADREMAASISNRYPRLNFSLVAAIRSNSFEDLIQSQAVSLTTSLLQPLFYGGRLEADIDRNEAIREQNRFIYGQTVLTAMQEVENALIQEFNQTRRIEIIKEQLDMAVKAYGQLRIEYLNGTLPYLDVLVAINQEQQLRRDLLAARLNLVEFRIALYRALAGGFYELKNDDYEMEENKKNDI